MQSCVCLRVICFWFVTHWDNCTLCLDSEVEDSCLHVLSTAQADAESSYPRGSAVCFHWGLVMGRGRHSERVAAVARWVLLCCVFLFFFYMVVPSYLLVHSICTKKLDWRAAVCLFREKWNSVFFFYFVCSRLTGLRTLRYTKNIC